MRTFIPASGSRSRPGGNRVRTPLWMACAGLLLLPSSPAAHEVPPDVTVRVLIRADRSALHILVRAPLEAMRDIEFAQIGDGYLDLAAARPQLRDAARMWIGDYLTLFADGESLGRPRLVRARASLPSSPAFSSFEAARDHLSGPGLPSDTRIVWQQAMLDAQFEVPLERTDARFAIRSGLAHLGAVTTTRLAYEPPPGDGSDGRGGAAGVHRFEFVGDPGRIHLDPTRANVARRFVRAGVQGAWTHVDALVLAICLVIPIAAALGIWSPLGTARNLVTRVLVPLAAGAAFGFAGGGMGLLPGGLWFPPASGAAVALLLLLTSLDNLLGPRVRARPWLAASGGLLLTLGLWPGFEAARQYAGAHPATATLAYTIGLACGLGLLGYAAFLLGRWGFRHLAPGRIGSIVVSVLIAHAAWHWLGDRGAHLLEHPVPVPSLDAAFLADVLGWAMLLLVAAALAVLLPRGARVIGLVKRDPSVMIR